MSLPETTILTMFREHIEKRITKIEGERLTPNESTRRFANTITIMELKYVLDIMDILQDIPKLGDDLK